MFGRGLHSRNIYLKLFSKHLQWDSNNCQFSFFPIIFWKGHNSKKGHNSEKKKKYVSAIFPWGIHIWNFKTLACTVSKLQHGSKVTCMCRRHKKEWPPHTHTHPWTSQKQYAPPIFFKVGGINTVIILKFKQCCFTVELCVQKIKKEWKTVWTLIRLSDLVCPDLYVQNIRIITVCSVRILFGLKHVMCRVIFCKVTLPYYPGK